MSQDSLAQDGTNKNREDYALHVDTVVRHHLGTLTLRVASEGGTCSGNICPKWGIQDVIITSVIPHPSPPAPPSTPGQWTFLAHDAFPGATGWSSNVPLQMSVCGDLGTMLGGEGVLGNGDYVEKNFTNLEPHASLRIQLTFIKIDRAQDAVVYVDGGVAFRQTVAWSDGSRQCADVRRAPSRLRDPPPRYA